MNVLLLNLRTDADDDVLGFTTSWINSIARRVDSVSVITMTCGRLAVDANVRVFSLGKEKGNSKPRRALEFYRHIIAIVSERRIHVCFAHMAPLFAAMASPILGPLRIPIVLWYAHKAVNNILKLATAVSTVVVASSASGFRIATPKLRIIGQGIDTELFQPDEQTADTQNSLFVVGTVGRVSRVKNIHQIIEAFGQIVKSRPHAPRLLKVVGAPLNKADQQYLSTLESMVSEQGLSLKVIFQGSVRFPEVHRVTRQLNLFVNVADNDSVDKAVLEAMSSGIPVVTSNLAFSNILSNDLACRVCVPKNSSQRLVEKMIDIIDSTPEERKQFGQELRRVVCRDHSIGGLADRLIAIFTEISRGSSSESHDRH